MTATSGRSRRANGRWCWSCGDVRPEGLVEGDGRWTCGICARLDDEELRYRRAVADLSPMVTVHGLIRGSEWDDFAPYLEHPDIRVRWYAQDLAAADAEGRRLGLEEPAVEDPLLAEPPEVKHRDEPEEPQELAFRVLRGALEPHWGRRAGEHVGEVQFLGAGVTYQAWFATVALPRARGVEEVEVVARLPHPDVPADQIIEATREARLLRRLGSRRRAFRVPHIVAAVPVSAGIAPVQELAWGLPVELRAPRCPSTPPWHTIADAAARCHAVPIDDVTGLVPWHGSRLAHARFELRGLERLADEHPEARDALAWSLEHLPADAPPVLLHGDLVGENVLMPHQDDLDEDDRPALIDWTEARAGDPAYDLAIVTRGVRRPFHVPSGLERLVDAYEERSGAELGAAAVRLYELVLVADHWEYAHHMYGAESPQAQEQSRRLLRILKRAHAA